MKTMNILCTLLCTMLATLPAMAQNTDDNKNKAIIEANDGSHELNTDEISVIRFDGGKVTVVQPWGETTYDRTLRSLSFQRSNPNTVRLTATTSIGTDAGNRAQAIDGDGKLKSTWESGDVVYVYADASTTTNIGTLTPKSYGSSTATLTGDINAEGLSDGETTLYFSTKDRSTLDLSQQDGTVESLFYFTATGTATIVGANASVSDLSFSRSIAVVKFTLKDKGNSDAPINATSLTVNVDGTPYSISPATPTAELFFGIPGFSDKTITLTASDGLSSYSYEKTGVTFTDSKYYAINVKMTNNTNYLTIPLTFEAKTAGAVVSFSSTMDTPPTIEYSLNGEAWTTYSSGITLTNVGDKVSFRGNNAAYATSYEKYSSFTCTKDCHLYGNIMSLTSKEGFASATSLTENYAFCKLFYDNTHICDHASKTLKLPATTLTEWCYYVLFRGCSQLTKAPELPATTLADYCYANMFASCSGLATAPELPATNLAKECYTGMFSSCTGLKVAPALPATTMAIRCYYTMFSGCTGLTSAPVLPAMTLATDCYYGMFWGCTGLTSGPALPATTLEEGCYWCMFYNCSNLVSAPALPATTMKKLCYYSMFEGCSKLTTPPALPATTMAEDCYGYMFRGCSELQSAPALPATSMVKDCYYGMFMACSSLSTPPELPATSLKESCYAYMFYNCTSLTSSPVLSVSHLYNKEYSNMFYGCSNLSSVTCLAIYVGGGSVSNWLNGVAATGTFYKAASMDGWTSGASGIPSGWTTENYVEGALKGQFTVNAGGGKVYFSMGNLQYQANSTGATSAPYTGVWRFAGHQYEAIGSGNSNVSASYDGWIDSFGWGSGNQPTQTSEEPNVYSTFVDWGTNAISNGGNTANLWRTLSESEWTYLVFTRPNADSKRGRATINGMYCYVLLPDDWTLPTGLSFTPDADNWTNVYTAAQWAQMEAAGAICLPASGSRAGGTNNTNINNFNEWCCYWSSTSANSTQGYNLWITSNHVGTTDKGNYQMGASVRLVQNIVGAGSISYATAEVNKTTADEEFTNELTLVGDGTVTYARSAGDNICTVNATTGVVTLNGNTGTCTITATVTDSPFYTYATTTASYTLTVTAATIDLSAVTANTTIPNGWTVTGTLTNNVKISIADGATVTLSNVNINGSGTWTSGNYAGLTCEGDATIILSGENILRGIGVDYPGIHIKENKTLTIRGTGSLDASGNPTGNCYSAGIGGDYYKKCGNIVIEGGTITATGGNKDGAAIGGAYCGGYGYITISGGTVTATAVGHGAGIGSGSNSKHTSGNITISGGTVTARSQGNGAGIGSGSSSDGSVGDILISGGTITATGGNNAAGIGSSNSSSCGGITIANTVTRVTATKGSGAPNSIGAGNGGTCGTVTIGGVVGAITESPYTYPTPAPAAAEATAEDKGKLIGTDGRIYADVAAATAAGTTAVAKIIYIGTTGHATYTHGLALALTDEGQMAWQAAIDACSAKNTSTPVTDATWLLASQDQWNYMLGASGAGSHTALRDGFSGITGASNLLSAYYWSSTELNSYTAREIGFYYGNWESDPKSDDGRYARACLAF